MPRCRQPSHAGSWYERNSDKLSQQIEGWLAKAHTAEGSPAARAIIAP
jgi:AmmeMemoRadiSam system protein B